MSDFQPHFDLSRLVAALDEDLQSQLEFLSIIPDTYTNVQRYLVSDLQSVRFNILSDMLSISDLWRNIRSNQPVVDLLLELTSNLHIHAQSSYQNGWVRLCELLADSQGCFNHNKINGPNCALDDDEERERYTDPEVFGDFLQSNPWLVTLLLLRRTRTVRKAISEIATRALRGQAPTAAPGRE